MHAPESIDAKMIIGIDESFESKLRSHVMLLPWYLKANIYERAHLVIALQLRNFICLSTKIYDLIPKPAAVY